jgi:cytochrome c oxidase assembly protein subunit 15
LLVPQRLVRLAAATLGWNVVVILWGAFVRATGSGAGCGSHWPLCNGEVVPRAPAAATVIEMTHRLTSGIALVLVLWLTVACFRAVGKGHPLRRAAAASLVLILVEAAIGAGLVVFDLVGQDASIARAVYMAVHLVNTFLLLAALALTLWWARGGAHFRRPAPAGGHLAAAALGLLLVAASGGIAALGDTLFPATSLAEGLAQDLSPAAHVLVRLRVLHPLIAVAVGAYVVFLPQLVQARRCGPAASRLGTWVALLALVQLAVGAANVGLLAPIWMQLVHLLLADALWIAFVMFAAATLAAERTPLRRRRLDPAADHGADATAAPG